MQKNYLVFFWVTMTGYHEREYLVWIALRTFSDNSKQETVIQENQHEAFRIWIFMGQKTTNQSRIFYCH